MTQNASTERYLEEKRMTYRELITWAEANTNFTDPELTLGQMMDVVEEQTGVWPNWDDQVPEWIMNEFGARA